MKLWRDRIAEARERKRGLFGRWRTAFTDDDRWAADHWYACAVGEQHAAVPLQVEITKTGEPIPMDRALYQMGMEFDTRVRRNDIDGAEWLLNRIEDRALQLKREQS